MNALALAAPSTTSGRWLQTLSHWPQAVLRQLQHEPVVVRVLVASLRGSAPREAGACMLVGRNSLLGTIGGGYLEFQAQRAAQALLDDPKASTTQLRKLILGAELGQCCGGVVELWLERFSAADAPLLHTLADGGEWHSTLLANGRAGTRHAYGRGARTGGRADGVAGGLAGVRLLRDAGETTLIERIADLGTPLYLYGAGHVGQALVRLLGGLPFSVTWIDPRAELLPADVPASVTPLATACPVETVPTAPAGTCFVVMTHDHALDYALCRAILLRGDARFVGVIGSHSKAARFRSRLARDGLSAEQIAPLVCPIGIAGIASKLPAAIAVGVAAQLLQTASLASATTASDVATPAPIETCTAEGCAACPQHHRGPR
jgi:xanthine dehydrogenase accessory factor